MSDAPLLLALLVSRWLFLREDEPVSTDRVVWKSLVEVVLLALLVAFQTCCNTTAFAIPVVVIGGNFALLLAERKVESPGARCLTLVAIIFPFLVAAPVPLNLMASSISPVACIIAISALLSLKESNFLIRWFFRRNRLAEKIAELPATENGRLIGNLERLLLLTFLWQGVPVAAPIIVAVKGLARFKQMNVPAFAEYVIIGTFLSVLCAFAAYGLSLLL